MNKNEINSIGIGTWKIDYENIDLVQTKMVFGKSEIISRINARIIS